LNTKNDMVKMAMLIGPHKLYLLTVTKNVTYYFKL